MVPAPASTGQGARHPARGFAGDRKAAHLLRRGSIAGRLGVAAGFLILGGTAGADAPPEPVTWSRAFLVGSVARTPGGTEAITQRTMQPVELHLVVEGERDSLPVYGTFTGRFRIGRRAVAERLVVSPQDAGLQDAKIAWIELRPGPDGHGWIRTRLASGENQWTLPVLELPGEDRPDDERAYGTARFAAMIEIRGASGTLVLGTPGWKETGDDLDPERAPGFRVTRGGGPTLVEAALGLARLPVRPDALDAHFRAWIALRPADLLLGAYEQLAGGSLPGDRAAPLGGPGWDWLFRRVVDPVRRRGTPGAAVVGPSARGVAWGPADSAHVVRGDALLFAGGRCAILAGDDGDGWLDEDDEVVHDAKGEVRRGFLRETAGRDFAILRARDFTALRAAFTEAGYTGLGQPTWYGPEMQRACREFQSDHGLESTGIPDVATAAALDEFLARLRSADSGASAP